jgi:ABC-type nitrate/sulfonate/bicarbonate transport system permease component
VKYLRPLLNLAIILLVWEIIGQFQLVASGALPPPSAVFLRLITDWSDSSATSLPSPPASCSRCIR